MMGKTYWHNGAEFPEGEASDEWDHETGLPGVALIGNAIQVWAMMNEGAQTVRATAEAFNINDAQVRQAVATHYWMFLEGPDDDPTKQIIQHEGE
jgi:hypothetical protein